MQHRACCEIQRARQDTVPISLVKVLEGLGISGKLGLEGLLLSHVFQLIV